MTKLHQSLLGTILGASILAFSGCGGGDSSDSSDVSTAYLVDSAVKGVSYHCGTQSGTTGADGSFNYQHGQTCTFNIGATTFSVAADKLAAEKSITPYDIFAGDDEKVVNLARLLQTLDSDKNATNGIDINATAHAQITHQIDFGSDFNITAEAAGSVYANQIVTSMNALAHLAETVAAQTRTTYTAFERIAVLNRTDIAAESGFSDKDDQARYVAQKIATYFYKVKDSDINDSEGDWVLGGAPAGLTTLSTVSLSNPTNSEVNPYILEIPSAYGKAMVVEACNKLHAGRAIKLTGEIHGPALPCEIAVYTDETTGKIYVDILDPVGSFALFFNDVAPNLEFAKMALQVKTEIKLITYKGLDYLASDYEKRSDAMGPQFTAAEIPALGSAYITYTYDINTSDANWTSATNKRAMAQKAAAAVIKAMTVNLPKDYTSITFPTFVTAKSNPSFDFNASGYKTATSMGINGNSDVNGSLIGTYAISLDGKWRSARYEPLKVPRHDTNTTLDSMYTVEACSPTHAPTALGMEGDSRNHATALPCQMTFYIDDSGTTPKLKVVFLDPKFMFGTLFRDKMPTDQGQVASLNSMVTTVTNDLVNITRYIMDTQLSWVTPKPNIAADQ